LGHQRQFSKAAAVFEGLLPQIRDPAAQNSPAYRPDLATTLTNLGNVYDETDRFAYKGALAIRRDLATPPTDTPHKRFCDGQKNTTDADRALTKSGVDMAESSSMKRLMAVAVGDYLPPQISCRALGRWNLRKFRRFFFADGK